MGSVYDTNKQILVWSLFCGFSFLSIIILLCLCSCSKRRRMYEPIPSGNTSIRKNYYESFRQFQDFIIDTDEIVFGKELGKGAFGTVYVGKFRGSQVAVKRMELPLDVKEGSETFVTEVLALSKLRNRNIVQFMGICIYNENPCIMMEYMKGGSVAKVIHNDMKQLDLRTVLTWSLHAVIGMEFLHAHKPHPIIHRDLKSDNLLVDENGLVKVGDFGTAKLLRTITKRQTKFTRKKHAKYVTSSGEFPGTVAWAAPEVLPPRPPKKAQKYTMAADVYSFGITLWEMVSNKRPFTGYKFEFQIMDAVISGVRPTIPSSCEEHLSQLIVECWHPDLLKRPTFSVVHEILDRMMNKLTISEILHGDGKRGSSV